MSRIDVKISDDELSAKIDEFRKWIQTEPDLPQNIDKVLLTRYLKTYGFKLDKAQALLKFGFNLRKNNQHIFTNRDFLSPEIIQVFNTCEMVPMLKATPENYKCCIMRLIDFKSESFIFNDVIKAFFMVADVRLVSPDPNPDALADGEVPIFDMKGATIWHILKVTLSTLRLYFKYVQEAHPVRVQQVHVYNCSSLTNRIMTLIRPFLKPEVAARFQFHTPGSDTLYNFVPKDILPEEYGGNSGPMHLIKDHWVKIFMQRREYIMNDANWIVSKGEDLNNNISKVDSQ